MAIDPQEVRRIAALSRLELDHEGVERTARELSSVLDFVAALARLDLEGCEPTAFAPRAGALRPDAIDEQRRLGPERALAGAPEGEDGFFLVPPIVENVNP